MREVFDSLPHTKINEPLAHHIKYLVDTCFIYYIFEKHEKEFIEFCKHNSVGFTSFNVEETLFHSHDVGSHFKIRFRHAIKAGLFLNVVDVDVKPGNPYAEKIFVQSLDARLINLIPDPSDAVLAAVAKSISANILTRDKHHLFTQALSNYFGESGLQVLNKLP